MVQDALRRAESRVRQGSESRLLRVEAGGVRSDDLLDCTIGELGRGRWQQAFGCGFFQKPGEQFLGRLSGPWQAAHQPGAAPIFSTVLQLLGRGTANLPV